MSKRKQTARRFWFIIALVAVLLAAPNGTLIKVASESLDLFTLNSLRFALISVVTVPYVLYMWKRFNSKNFKYSIYMGLSMAVAALSYSTAIHLSQASYVSIIALGMPIVFIIYSLLLTKERVHKRSIFGIGLAALGAFLVVALPIISSGDIVSEFHPMATVFAIVDIFAFPLAIIFSRKANEHGLPIMASFGVSSVIVTIVCTVLALLFFGTSAYIPAGSFDVGIAVFYSAIFVALIARVMNVASYEHLGSMAVSGVAYLESLLAIILPLVLLGERISIEIVVGGILILAGVYFVEVVHKSKKHRHIRVMQPR